MREYQRAPRGYELMALINPEITDEALTTAVDTVAGLITSFGGELSLIKRDTPWGRRRLAYPIQRFRDATYVLYQFMATPSSISLIERDLKLDERVIRYLLVRQDSPESPEDEASEEAPADENSTIDASTSSEDADDESSENDVAENEPEVNEPEAENEPEANEPEAE